MPPSAQLKRVRRIGYALYIILMVVALLIAVFVLRQHKPSRIEHRQAIAVLHHGGGFFYACRFQRNSPQLRDST